jgi:glutamate/tyrosine decarboxylase-like PLP-dependent enzyme
MLLSKDPGVLNGLSLADSVTIDPHKWFYAPLDAGAILVRDHGRLKASFGIQHAYLTDQSGQKNERYQFYVNGFEQSKRFRSLKVWMSFQHYGKSKIGSWIDGNIGQAKYLHELVSKSEDFISATVPRMSAICIRYLGEGLNDQQLAILHHDVAARIEKEGKFWFATTSMKAKTWFRLCPVNIYTTRETMKELFDTLGEYCRQYSANG